MSSCYINLNNEYLCNIKDTNNKSSSYINLNNEYLCNKKETNKKSSSFLNLNNEYLCNIKETKVINLRNVLPLHFLLQRKITLIETLESIQLC